MKPLSKAEEELLHILWSTEPAYMKEMLAGYGEEQPAKTTVATLIKRMIDKGYVSYDADGGIRKYTSTISKSTYLRKKITGLISNFFEDSPTQFASFFAEEIELSEKEKSEIRKMYDTNKPKEK